jgi:hypothetical protein
VQLHSFVTAALLLFTPGERTLVPIELESEWAPEAVWMFRRR